MTSDKKIQAYFNNQLSQKERLAFEKFLDENRDLKKQFEEYKAIQSAFKINEAEDLKKHLIDYENKKSKKSDTNQKLIYYAIAASILILIGIGFVINLSQDNLYKQYFEIYPNVYQPIVRSNAQVNNKAFLFYENGDYKSAQVAFEEMLKKEGNPNLRFYYALSYLNNGNAQKASLEFGKLKDVSFEFQAEVLWYYALAQIKVENYTQAVLILESLNKMETDFKRQETQKLLSSLK